MTTRIKKIIVKESPTEANTALFSIYVENPGEGEPVIVTSTATITAPEDFASNMTDAAQVTWADIDIP
jgi:hypothetical protein